MSDEYKQHHFEDMEDFMDFLMGEIQDVIQLWILWHKLTLDIASEDLSKEILVSVIMAEHKNQYAYTFPIVEQKDGQIIIETLVIEK